MAADPWAVTSTASAAPPSPADPWSVAKTEPVAPPAAPPAQPADGGVFSRIGQWVQDQNAQRAATQKAQPGPQMPDIDQATLSGGAHMIAKAIGDQFMQNAKSFLPWQPLGAVRSDDNPAVVAGKVLANSIGRIGAAPRAAGAAIMSTVGGAQDELINKPLAQATGLPKPAVDTALMLGAVPEGRLTPGRAATVPKPDFIAPRAAAKRQPAPQQPVMAGGRLTDQQLIHQLNTAYQGDFDALSTVVRAEAQKHITAGGTVRLWRDGKPIDVTLGPKGFVNAQGLPEGLLPSLMPNTPGAGGIEFVTPVPAKAVAATPPAAPAKGPGAASVRARAMAAAKGEPAPAPPPVEAVAPELFDGAPPAAKPTKGRPNLPATPGPILDPPVGSATRNPTLDAIAATREPVEAMGGRVDDALHRLTTNADADKLQFENQLKAMPKEITDPAIQARVYDDIERRMIKSDAPITPGTEAAHAVLEPMRAEEADLFKQIKAKGYGDMMNGPEVGDGYVHRVVKGRGSFMDAADNAITGGQNADPVMPKGRSGGSTLSRDASSLRARKFMVLEHPDGMRSWVDNPDGMQVEKPFLGPNLQFLKPRYATTAEIEANTGVRYHKNALVNTVDNLTRLRAVNRNIDLLENLKKQMGDRGLIHYPQTYGAKGPVLEGATTPGGRPDRFVKITMPQFNGAYAEPHIAHALNDFHGELQRGGDFTKILSKVNRFMTGAMFITPIPHAWNVANHWITGRGWDNLKPSGMHSLLVDGTRAIKAVMTKNADYQALLREGSGLVYGGVHNQNFHRMLIDKLGGEIMSDQKAWTPIAKLFGFSNPVKLVKAIYRLSSKTLWATNDMFMIQRQLELMRKGMPVRKAILEAEKDIPNYRLPSYVGLGPDSVRRATSEVLRNPNLMMFGRYRYGQFKAYAEMGKEMFGSKATAKERVDGAGKLFIMAAMAMGAYPMLDRLLRAATGNDHAEVHRGGGLAPIKAVADMATGDKTFGAGMSSLFSPAPFNETVMEGVRNKDALGRNIIEPGSTPLGMGLQAAEYGASKLGPLGAGLNALQSSSTKGGVAAALAPMAAVKLPTDKSIGTKARSKMYDTQRGGKREAFDALEHIVKDLIR